ncbi:hypothetical protein [Sphingomonas bacterium]|uniref:hypothetical protein n=1 Tax=Sphingomonas bacterium TaxID=1895847 RepID=UPI001574FA1E|nr:hypothetical protein [Sphingomonas bacterium]
MKALLRLLAPILLSLFAALPAQAAVTITFWSHELGNSFPHAFVTLRGIPDAGGPPVDRNFGFTAKAVTPALLFGPVPGRLDIAKPGYIDGSTAQFSVVLTDQQYAAVVALATAWDDKGPDSTYNLQTHNCVHFVEEAARLVGLTKVDFPGLMKKPRSYLQAVAQANASQLIVVDQHGKEYLAALPPIVATPTAATPTVPVPDKTAATN